MSAHPNVERIREFYAQHSAYYRGVGNEDVVSAGMTDDVVWHVPGRSAIAGHYQGKDEVLDYFRRRRDLASATFQIHVRDVLAGDERAVVLAGGSATRAGREFAWETAGVFRLADGKVAECWLLPFDQYVFDEVWS